MPSESSTDEEEEEEEEEGELWIGGVNDHEVVLPFHETMRGGAKLETRFKQCKRMRAAPAVATMVEAVEQREEGEEGREAIIVVGGYTVQES